MHGDRALDRSVIVSATSDGVLWGQDDLVVSLQSDAQGLSIRNELEDAATVESGLA
jgi:hypothetical protein